MLTLRVDGGHLLVPAPAVAAGKRQRLRIAASDVILARAAPDTSSILNVLPARIVSKSLLGHGEVIVVLALGADGRGARLLARITLRSWDLLGLAEAMTVFAQVKGVSLVSGADEAASQGAGPDLIDTSAEFLDGISLASPEPWPGQNQIPHGVRKCSELETSCPHSPLSA